jgi:hypothetical protein
MNKAKKSMINFLFQISHLLTSLTQILQTQCQRQRQLSDVKQVQAQAHL